MKIYVPAELWKCARHQEPWNWKGQRSPQFKRGGKQPITPTRPTLFLSKKKQKKQHETKRFSSLKTCNRCTAVPLASDTFLQRKTRPALRKCKRFLFPFRFKTNPSPLPFPRRDECSHGLHAWATKRALMIVISKWLKWSVQAFSVHTHKHTEAGSFFFSLSLLQSGKEKTFPPPEAVGSAECGRQTGFHTPLLVHGWTPGELSCDVGRAMTEWLID